MNCKNKRIRTKNGIKYGYCILSKSNVPLFDCKCQEYQTKQTKTINNTTKHKTRLKSPKIMKLERQRFSILTNDLSKCFICGKQKQALHEIYEGAYRTRSMKYGCVIPLCNNCHLMIHTSHYVALKYKTLCETEFKAKYKDLNFNDIFFYKQ